MSEEISIKFVKEGYLLIAPNSQPKHYFYRTPEECLSKISELLNAWEKM